MVVVIIVWSKYWCLFWAKILALKILEDTDKVHSKFKIMAHMSPSWTDDNKLQTRNTGWYSSTSLADLYSFNLLGVTLQTLSAYYKVYVTANAQKHGGTLWTPTTTADKKYKSSMHEMISYKNNLASGPTESTQNTVHQTGTWSLVWISCWIVFQVCCPLTMGWFPPSSWHVE